MSKESEKVFGEIIKYVVKNKSEFNIHNLAAELSLQVMEKGEYHHVNDGEMIKNDIVRYGSRFEDQHYFRVQERLTKAENRWYKLTPTVCEVKPYLESKVSYIQLSPERCL